MDTVEVSETFRWEQRTYDIMLQYLPRTYSILDFQNKRQSTAAIDALVVRDGRIQFAVEQKTRNMSDWELANYGDELVINNAKWLNLKKTAEVLNVDVWMWTMMKKSDMVIATKMFNANAVPVAKCHFERGNYQHSASNSEHLLKDVVLVDVSHSLKYYPEDSPNQTDTSQTP